MERSLTKAFDIILPLDQWLTIRTALNQPEPPEEVEEEADPKKKK